MALEAMVQMGFNPAQCLADTGLSLLQLEATDTGFTLEQEHCLHRNMLRLSGDPMLGLKLGMSYRPEVFGVLGYAMLSSRTMKECLEILYDFGQLTYSFFRFGPANIEDRTGTALRATLPIPEDLIPFYSDRDIQAGFTLFESLGMGGSEILEVHLAHDAGGNLDSYESWFGCPVATDKAQNAVIYNSSILDIQLPQQDEETAHYCRVQCERLLTKISGAHSMTQRVTELMFSTPGHFLCLDDLALEIGMSARSLRRRLHEEGSTYQDILRSVRLDLAKDYLASSLSMERISDLLGFSEVSVFSRAFKQWTGVAPKVYKKQHLSRADVFSADK
ncbi:MAG: AraC family transcriptional regulator [Pseudomonadota bacterium]